MPFGTHFIFILNGDDTVFRHPWYMMKIEMRIISYFKYSIGPIVDSHPINIFFLLYIAPIKNKNMIITV